MKIDQIALDAVVARTGKDFNSEAFDIKRTSDTVVNLKADAEMKIREIARAISTTYPSTDGLLCHSKCKYAGKFFAYIISTTGLCFCELVLFKAIDDNSQIEQTKRRLGVQILLYLAAIVVFGIYTVYTILLPKIYDNSAQEINQYNSQLTIIEAFRIKVLNKKDALAQAYMEYYLNVKVQSNEKPLTLFQFIIEHLKNETSEATETTPLASSRNPTIYSYVEEDGVR